MSDTEQYSVNCLITIRNGVVNPNIRNYDIYKRWEARDGPWDMGSDVRALRARETRPTFFNNSGMACTQSGDCDSVGKVFVHASSGVCASIFA